LHETRLIIEEGLTIGSKPLKEYLGAKNHPDAIRFIETLVEKNDSITEEDILKLHGLILHEIEEYAGRYRKSGVRVAGAYFQPPRSSEISKLMSELIEWLKKNIEELSPIEQAALFHYKFVKIHPFSDGNGRTARLLMNLILLKNGYPFIINITQNERRKYLDALKEADLGNLFDFVNFIAKSAEKVLDIYLNSIEEPDILTLNEASKISPYSADYLGLLSRKGRIGSFKENNRWYIRKDELMRYVNQMKEKNI
jgi:Fic family protein